MSWRIYEGSSAVGNRSLLREMPSLSPAAPSAQRGEIRLSVKRSENGAAHQSSAAQCGQNRAGEPLHRHAAAIDKTRRAAVDRQRRLVAEVDGLGLLRPMCE